MQVFFKAAVHTGDVVDLEAQVVYATKHTVHVQTRVKIHRQTPKTAVTVLEDSHSGTFVCLCINDGENGGGKRPIGRKLLVTAEDGDTEGGDEEERLRLLRWVRFAYDARCCKLVQAPLPLKQQAGGLIGGLHCFVQVHECEALA